MTGCPCLFRGYHPGKDKAFARKPALPVNEVERTAGQEVAKYAAGVIPVSLRKAAMNALGVS